VQAPSSLWQSWVLLCSQTHFRIHAHAVRNTVSPSVLHFPRPPLPQTQKGGFTLFLQSPHPWGGKANHTDASMTSRRADDRVDLDLLGLRQPTSRSSSSLDHLSRRPHALLDLGLGASLHTSSSHPFSPTR
jgi:hypothetical protein